MAKREPRSPWQKYEKKKWLYSPMYQLWREAVLSQGAGSERALQLTCDHAKRMQVVNEVCSSED